MANNPNPISNPGVTPPSAVPAYGPDKPRLGSQEEIQERPFSIGPGAEKAQPEAAPLRPSPMEIAGDTARQHPQISPEDLQKHIAALQENLSQAKNKVNDPATSQQLTSDHQLALQKLTQKMNPDMQSIAKYSDGQFEPTSQGKEQSVLEYVVNWINGSQGTLGNALSYLQTTQNPDPISYLRLQYAVQRATQRGELFTSIIGASVSGIKTIMSTQLG